MGLVSQTGQEGGCGGEIAMYMTGMQFCMYLFKLSKAVLRIKSYQNGQKDGPMTLCCPVYLS